MKKQKIQKLLFLTFWAVTTLVKGQCPDPFYFVEQKHIDSFGIQFPNCKTITMDIVLNQNEPSLDPIVNLNGFANVDTFLGHIFFTRTNLVNFKGFENVKYIGGILNILKNPLLESFTGFENLREVGGGIYLETGSDSLPKNFKGFDKLERVHDLYINGGPGLQSFEGLENLRQIEYGLDLNFTDIRNFNGLENLDTVGYGIALTRLDYLTSMEGLEKLKHATIAIFNCDSLLNLVGLDSLESGGDIFIARNQRLESLDGLENFKSFSSDKYPITGRLILHKNSELHDLSALDHPLKIEGLIVQENPKLNACSVQAICQYLPTPGDTTVILDNLTNCNSAAEILLLCTSATSDSVEKTGFKISPNPVGAGQSLQILLENNFLRKVKIEFLSLDGRVIFEDLAPFIEKEVPVWSWPNGIYIVQIATEKGVFSEKLVVNH